MVWMTVEKLRTLYNLLKQRILFSEYIEVDDNVLPVIDNEIYKAKKGNEWCMVTAPLETLYFIMMKAAIRQGAPWTSGILP